MKLVHKPVFSLRHDRRMSKLSIFLVFGMGLVHNQLFRCPTLYSFDVHTDMGRGLIHILPHIKTRVIEGIFLSALDFIEGGVAERLPYLSNDYNKLQGIAPDLHQICFSTFK